MVALMCCCKKPKKNYRLFRSLFEFGGGVWDRSNKEKGSFSLNMNFKYLFLNPDNRLFYYAAFTFSGIYSPSSGVWSQKAKVGGYTSGFHIIENRKDEYNSPSLPSLDEVLSFFSKAPKPSDVAYSLEGNISGVPYESYKIVPFDQVYPVFLNAVRSFYNSCVNSFPHSGFEGNSAIYSLVEM